MNMPLTVLLVEDEPTDCTAFVQCIEQHHDIRLIEVTNNAEKALEYARTHLPDVIILDLELHKGSGNGISFLLALNKERSVV
ncbi:MAG: response regulator, partial [Oscillospiraceae bacterium]|nr:response regulator [Oscillospiraceae bacterium]MCL2278238.1 response regulator [Oscillospiraceae bacterium]